MRSEGRAVSIMSQAVLHQFQTGAAAGDAITGQALLLRGWLRDLGFTSHIYAQHIDPSVAGEARPLVSYRRQRGETWAIYRHSIGSDAPDFLRRQRLRLLLIYHNVTPPAFFAGVDPQRAHLAALGEAQLRALQPHTGLALADSPFNAQALRAAGYGETAVLPIALDPAAYDLPPDPAIVAQLHRTGPNLLFVGRLAPNKKQEDLVKLLYFYRRIRPGAHLYLVGDRWQIGYDRWVERLAADLGVADGLTLSDKVSQQAMVTYYKTADLYVSLSEHEGFGVPLVESMLLGLPVLAYAETAVPDTMGAGGVRVYRKDYERLAELVDILVHDQALRARLITGQNANAQRFLAPNVRRTFGTYLQRINLYPPP